MKLNLRVKYPDVVTKLMEQPYKTVIICNNFLHVSLIDMNDSYKLDIPSLGKNE